MTVTANSAPLAPCTTLGVGGAARWLAEPSSTEAVCEALAWADRVGVPVVCLGGGSNVLIADGGFDGLVLRPRLRGLTLAASGEVFASAGEQWDDIVDACVQAGLQGIECMTGIPGWAGAAPIQNIGAYGQEVADVLVSVDAVRVSDQQVVRLSREACAFGYRDSRFKRDGGYIVTGLTLQLAPDRRAAPRYAELSRALGVGVGDEVSLSDARAAVRSLRISKGMLLETPSTLGPDARSAGSFFTNPVVDDAVAAALPDEAPRYASGVQGRTKLSAAWLVEHAGWTRGRALGRAAVSSRHTLALVNSGSATALELVRLAAHVRADVRARFGVTLSPEPVFIGFDATGDALLDAWTP